MAEYRCRVEIDVDAKSPQEAARTAYELLTNPEAIPWIVEVFSDDQGPPVEVDLDPLLNKEPG
jgi:hypothetical protein